MEKLPVYLVSFNTPWVTSRLEGIKKWWGIPFEFEVMMANQTAIEHMPWGEATAALDYAVMGRWRDTERLTVLCAPYISYPRDYEGEIIQNHALVNGIAFLNYQDKETCIQVFANELDHSYVNQVDQGDTFSVFFNHELAHYFYFKLGLPDRTHMYFYSGCPEKARDEILAALNA